MVGVINKLDVDISSLTAEMYLLDSIFGKIQSLFSCVSCISGRLTILILANLELIVAMVKTRNETYLKQTYFKTLKVQKY